MARKRGLLEIHEQLGGRFQDWAKVTPRHNSFIDAIIQSKCHIITTTRSKVDYSLDKDSNGKTKVMKLGTKALQEKASNMSLQSTSNSLMTSISYKHLKIEPNCSQGSQSLLSTHLQAKN